MRFARLSTDFGSITNRYCERKLLRQLQRPAISKTSCAISSRWFERKDTNYCKAPHELHELSRMSRLTESGRGEPDANSWSWLRLVGIGEIRVCSKLCL